MASICLQGTLPGVPNPQLELVCISAENLVLHLQVFAWPLCVARDHYCQVSWGLPDPILEVELVFIIKQNLMLHEQVSMQPVHVCGDHCQVYLGLPDLLLELVCVSRENLVLC